MIDDMLVADKKGTNIKSAHKFQEDENTLRNYGTTSKHQKTYSSYKNKDDIEIAKPFNENQHFSRTQGNRNHASTP